MIVKSQINKQEYLSKTGRMRIFKSAMFAVCYNKRKKQSMPVTVGGPPHHVGPLPFREPMPPIVTGIDIIYASIGSVISYHTKCHQLSILRMKQKSERPWLRTISTENSSNPKLK